MEDSLTGGFQLALCSTIVWGQSRQGRDEKGFDTEKFR
jgi:hypothetical protein